MSEKVVKAYNLDRDITEWIKSQGHANQMNASQFLNVFLRAAIKKKKK